MVQINLLPWREKLREESQKEFLVLLGIAAGIAIFFLGLVFIIVNGKINRVADVNTYLQAQTALLDVKIAQIQDIKSKRADLIARRKVLQQLQIQRVSIVHLLEQVVYKVPDGIYLTKLDKKGAQLTVSGVAESNTRVSEFMQSIEASRWISNPRLTQIKADDTQGSDSKIRNFEITMTEHLPDIAHLAKGGNNGT